jgi:cation:H+ antiporter
MTGANRLLLGVGWPFVAFLWWRRSRKTAIELEPSNGGEIAFLALATVWSFAIPLKGTLSILDAGILFLLFGLYLRFAHAQPVEDVHLAGPAEVLGRADPSRRRAATAVFFLLAGAGIFACSEPFAEGLLAAGGIVRIDEYYLVQWLAPLASESPEFLVAAVLVWHLQPTVGFGALLSSKVNQWTLLVGAVPVAFALSAWRSGHGAMAMEIDRRQCGEILLTAAQSYAGVCVLLNRRFELREAGFLFVLFMAQLVLSITLEELQPANLERWMWSEKLAFSLTYLMIGTAYLIGYRKHLRGTMSIAFPRRSKAGGG